MCYFQCIMYFLLRKCIKTPKFCSSGEEESKKKPLSGETERRLFDINCSFNCACGLIPNVLLSTVRTRKK